VIEYADILTAFWHKGRHVFAEWTSQEIAKRAGLEVTVAGRRLGALMTNGIVIGQRLPQNADRGWRLTSEGERFAASLLRRQ
jgi:predicted transcriptional regulator